MKLTLNWKYPNEERVYTAKYFNINPNKINISYGYLYFECFEDKENAHWQFPLDHIVEMNMEEE